MAELLEDAGFAVEAGHGGFVAEQAEGHEFEGDQLLFVVR